MSKGVLAIDRQQFLVSSDIRKIVYSVQANLEHYREAINKLNVFPVPDGDTGSNLSQTVNKVADDLRILDSDSMNEILEAIVQASLMGARGNSGVILSQIIRGICESLALEPAVTAEAIVKGLKAGVIIAYQSVLKPVEGTMLTVIRGASEEAASALEQDPALDPEGILEWAAIGARKSLESTPELLPVLKEAGVVDAGGYGLVIMLESALSAVKGTELQHIDDLETGTVATVKEETSLTFDYCTEFVIKAGSLDKSALEERLAELGDSVVVAGAGQLHRVHVHTDDPGKALDIGVGLGEISDIKINNMREQAYEFQAMSQDAQSQGIVAVANGDGNKEIFLSLGVDALVSGGQSMNPSAEEILEAIEKVRSNNVIVLPNNKNVIMTAKQAGALTSKTIEVVETTSMPQAFTALLEYEPYAELKVNVEKMRKSLGRIKVGEIAKAVRDSKTNGIKIREGEYLVIIEDDITGSEKDLKKAVRILIVKLIAEDSEVITVLLGGELGDSEKAMVSASIKKAAKDKQVDIHDGGQSLYYLIVGVE